MNAENKNYPFTIVLPSEENPKYQLDIKTDGYIPDYGKFANYDFGNGIKFERLNGPDKPIKISETAYAFSIGLVNINGSYVCIDSIKNHNNLLNIEKFYNSQSFSAFTNNYEMYIKYKNVFDALDFTRLETAKLNSYSGKAFVSNVSKMYDSSYCTLVYRAARNFTKIKINDRKIFEYYDTEGVKEPAKLAVFTIDIPSSIDDPIVYAVVRGFKFAYRRIKTSAHDNISTYVFEYPEYLFKDGKYRNSDISYMESNFDWAPGCLIGYSPIKNTEYLMYHDGAKDVTAVNLSEDLRAI
jgi:hypothetical protein